MHVFTTLLTLSTLGCAIVTGITLVFAIVIMPGLKSLGDRGFLQAFKAIDSVIQNNQPVFMLVWLGSALALIASSVLGFWFLEGADLALLIAACALYLSGVQAATVVVNVPLNNRLQAQALDKMDDTEIAQARHAFEPRWLRWNTIRTWVGTLVTILLLVVLSRT